MIQVIPFGLHDGRGTVAPELIRSLRDGSGYRDLAEDLNTLAHELLALPAHLIGPAAPVTRAEVERGAQIAHEILTRMGEEVVDLGKDALGQSRQKLGALLVRAHGQLRRAMTYLRYEQGDAAELVPSLYVPSSGRGPGTSPEDEQADHDAAELSALHDRMHAATPAAPLHPDDNPFAAED